MKFYSEELKKFFDTEEDCVEAEEQAYIMKQEAEEKKAKLAEERKARAEEVEDALKKVQEAKENYNKILIDFCKDYGSYHYSWNEKNLSPTIFDFLGWL